MAENSATQAPPPPETTISFPPEHAALLEEYLPPPPPPPAKAPSQPAQAAEEPHTATQHKPPPKSTTDRPFVTLTYAQSLDGQIASRPGARTTLSGAETKAMTHFLRSRHDAILVGVGTAVADDPGLNCRLDGGGSGERRRHPRPVVLDPRARWDVRRESKVVRLAREGRGMAPWVLCAEGVCVDGVRRGVVEGVGGRYVFVPRAGDVSGGEDEDVVRLSWDDVLRVLRAEGVGSVMIEGGGRVLDDLLALESGRGETGVGAGVVDSVVVTLAPCWLGKEGVEVSPVRPVDAQGREGTGPRLDEVRWVQMGSDMVLCGRIQR